MKIHGAWAYGFALNVFVLDEYSRHDSAAITEIIAITIEDDPWFKKLYVVLNLKK